MQKHPFLHLIAKIHLHIVDTLLKETDVGKQLIQFADNNSISIGIVSEVLEQRDQVREKINNLFKKRRDCSPEKKIRGYFR
jgi:hypothetical protein